MVQINSSLFSSCGLLAYFILFSPSAALLPFRYTSLQLYVLMKVLRKGFCKARLPGAVREWSPLSVGKGQTRLEREAEIEPGVVYEKKFLVVSFCSFCGKWLD